MHPIIHSKSSAKHFGGDWEDYIAIHNWLDSSKVHVADCRHRHTHHHDSGVERAVERFGEYIPLSNGSRALVSHRVWLSSTLKRIAVVSYRQRTIGSKNYGLSPGWCVISGSLQSFVGWAAPIHWHTHITCLGYWAVCLVTMIISWNSFVVSGCKSDHIRITLVVYLTQRKCLVSVLSCLTVRS